MARTQLNLYRELRASSPDHGRKPTETVVTTIRAGDRSKIGGMIVLRYIVAIAVMLVASGVANAHPGDVHGHPWDEIVLGGGGK